MHFILVLLYNDSGAYLISLSMMESMQKTSLENHALLNLEILLRVSVIYSLTDKVNAHQTKKNNSSICTNYWWTKDMVVFRYFLRPLVLVILTCNIHVKKIGCYLVANYRFEFCRQWMQCFHITINIHNLL